MGLLGFHRVIRNTRVIRAIMDSKVIKVFRVIKDFTVIRLLGLSGIFGFLRNCESVFTSHTKKIKKIK